MGPREAIANLDELYSSRGSDSASAGTPSASRGREHATYATTVSDRGFFARTGDSFLGLFSDTPPVPEREELEDPVDFGLENLAEIAEAEPDDLDEIERTRALAVVAEMGRIDPSRVLRARGLETTHRLWQALGAGTIVFTTRSLDEAAVNAQIDALFVLSNAQDEEALALVTNLQGQLSTGARTLAALRPESFSLAQKLLLLTTRCARIVSDAKGPEPLKEELDAAMRALAGQVAYLAARPDFTAESGLADPAEGVRIYAGRLLVAVDPIAATVDLGKLYGNLPEARVRVAWLQALAESKIQAVSVHPSLRAALAIDLDADDAAVAWWAKEAVARLLGADAAKNSVAELKARWLALGEWDAAGRA